MKHNKVSLCTSIDKLPSYNEISEVVYRLWIVVPGEVNYCVETPFSVAFSLEKRIYFSKNFVVFHVTRQCYSL